MPTTFHIIQKATLLGMASVLGAEARHPSPAGAPPAPDAVDAVDAIPLLLPGSRELIADHFRTSTVRVRVLSYARTAGTAPRALASFTRDERPAGDAGERLLLAFRYAPPDDVADSLEVDTEGLAPRTEWLRARGTTSTYRYEGRRVVGTVARGAAPPDSFALEFAEAPFSANELGAVVRSLPYRVGYAAVLPVFSPTTGNVTHDTVSVLGTLRDPRAGDRELWVVRLAEPVIVMTYYVDPTSRAIARQDVQWRANDARITLSADQPAAEPGAAR